MVSAAYGSLVIALALVEDRLGAAAAFSASRLDEGLQIEAGEDAEQAQRHLTTRHAARFLSLMSA
jgi:chaperone required for assembly of F1-ATPase